MSKNKKSITIDERIHWEVKMYMSKLGISSWNKLLEKYLLPKLREEVGVSETPENYTKRESYYNRDIYKQKGLYILTFIHDEKILASRKIYKHDYAGSLVNLIEKYQLDDYDRKLIGSILYLNYKFRLPIVITKNSNMIKLHFEELVKEIEKFTGDSTYSQDVAYHLYHSTHVYSSDDQFIFIYKFIPTDIDVIDEDLLRYGLTWKN